MENKDRSTIRNLMFVHDSPFPLYILRKLSRKAGILRINKSSLKEAGKEMADELTGVIKKAIVYTEHARRKIINKDDIVHATQNLGRTLYTTGKNIKN